MADTTRRLIEAVPGEGAPSDALRRGLKEVPREKRPVAGCLHGRSTRPTENEGPRPEVDSGGTEVPTKRKNRAGARFCSFGCGGLHSRYIRPCSHQDLSVNGHVVGPLADDKVVE